MKIAYIITGLGIGGAEKVTVDIANRISGLGNDVIIIYLTGKNLNAQNIEKSIKTYPLDMRKTPFGFIKALFKAKKILKDFNPDIVHGQMFHANAFARILRIFCKIPVLISTEHNKNIEGSLKMFVYRITDFLSDLNTNVSKEATDYFVALKAFGKAKSRCVYNGIDLSKFKFDGSAGKNIREQYGIKDNEFLFLNVGRLMPAKDQRTLIEAFFLLSKDHQAVRLIIVGEGELLKILEDFVSEKGLSGKVIFTGAKENVSEFYSAADCFVLSSAWEGFGIVIAEAMACGNTVIATDAGGCRELVDNPDFVVPVRDSKALYEKMKYVFNMTEAERKAIGTVNLEKSKKYNIDFIVRQWMEIYKS